MAGQFWFYAKTRRSTFDPACAENKSLNR